MGRRQAWLAAMAALKRPARLSAAVALGALALFVVAASPSRADEAEQVIQVDLQEWQLGFHTVEVEGDPIRFEIANNGQLEHAFELEGEVGGQEFEVATGLLEPGQRAVLVLTLPPGDYEVYCPVPGHREAGMVGKVIVRGRR